ncbi:MAG TPA: response regulator [Chthoniobacter sp.]|jgi:CheY-like chemotaxis protein
MQTPLLNSAADKHCEKSLRILVVDDDEHVRVLVKRTLTRLGHEIVGEGKSGVEAIQLFQETAPDLMILDVDMPHLDGVDAAEVILGMSNVPIIFISGFWDSATLKKVKQLNAAAYLTKPFSPAQLGVAVALGVPEPRP